MKLYDIQQEILKYFKLEEVDPSILSQQAQDELSIYHSLVLNGMEDLLQKIFSLTYKILEDQWSEIITDYLAKFPSTSPIYNHLCNDFPQYLGTQEFQAKYSYPNYLAELALYELTDLQIYNATDDIHRTLDFQYPISQIISYLKETEDDIKTIRETDIEEEAETMFIFRDPKTIKTRFFVVSEAINLVIHNLDQGLDDSSIMQNFATKFNNELDSETLATIKQDLKKMGILEVLAI